MKKIKKMSLIALILTAILCFTFTASIRDAQARGIGIKVGYVQMMDDYKDNYDNGMAFGANFDMGRFLFDSLRFKPGLDYIKLKNKNNNSALDVEVWGIHLDWYWYFFGKSKISPFLGFGAAMNILDNDDNNTNNDDSDAGLEAFAGIDIGITGSITLNLEARFAFIDIANRDDTMLKYYGGVTFFF